MGDIIVIIFSVVVGTVIFLVLVRVVRVISFSRCRLVDFSSLGSRGQQKQASGFTAIRTSLLFERSFRACSFNFPQFVRLECAYDWSGVSAVCLDRPAVAESEETVCVGLGGCTASCCGSIVIASGALMLRRPSLAVGITTGWSKTVDCISVSWAGSAVSAVSTAWAGVGLEGCMTGGRGSIVIASGALMLRRLSLAVEITGWCKTVGCISVSWVFEAGSAVSTAWAGVDVAGTSAAWVDGTVAVALACLVL